MGYKNDYVGLVEERFESLFKGKRLLAMKLDGFSHTVAFDNGHEEDEVEVKTYTGYAPELRQDKRVATLFNGIPHGSYQGNPFIYHWIKPDQR